MEGGWKNHITAKAISLASRDTKYKSFRVCMKEYSTARKERLQCEGTKREAGGWCNDINGGFLAINHPKDAWCGNMVDKGTTNEEKECGKETHFWGHEKLYRSPCCKTESNAWCHTSK
jgi:hypothetical protein